MTPDEISEYSEQYQAELREWARKRHESVTAGQFEMATFMVQLLQTSIRRLSEQEA